MELINEHISVHLSKDSEIAETACITKQEDAHIHVMYTLQDNECLFGFSDSFNVIQIHVAKTYFEKYEQPYDAFTEKQSICCNTQSKLYELIHCSFTGLARSIYLESIVLHLLFQIQKNSLIFHSDCDTCSFLNRPIELEKIQKAKEFIINHLDQNITIPILANFVGTNQCYLKKGFKEVTGQTVFEFLQENRMIKAHHLLQTTDKSVLEISMDTGYSSVSSFSQTYKRYFGIPPSATQKQFFHN